MSMGIRLHAARLAKGHSLRDAAVYTGLSPSTLSRTERNLSPGTLDTASLFRLAAYCGMSAEALVMGNDADISDEEVESFLVGLGYNLDELRAEINALIDELRATAKAILAAKEAQP